MTVRTPIAFGPLSLGCAPLGNLFRAVSDEAAQAALEAAWDAGIRSFDTAPHYGLGLSERRLGRFLAGKPRDEFTVSTKVGRALERNPASPAGSDLSNGFDVPATLVRRPDFTEAGMRQTLEGSLERLGLDRVDILYIHDPDEYDLRAALETALPGVAAMRDAGLVDAVGIGTKSIDALEIAVHEGDIDLVMPAGRYTLLEQPALAEVLPACEQRGIGVVNAAPFNSGLLASSTPDARSHYEYGAPPTAVLERARALAAVCAAHGVELPAAALQYTLRHPAVRTVVVGAGSAEHVRQNAARMAAPIPDSLWADLAERGLIP